MTDFREFTPHPPFALQAWDDVVRKEKPKEDAYEYKKRLTLDHEKSKLSLAEIYEQEYVKLHQVRRLRRGRGSWTASERQFWDGQSEQTLTSRALG